MLIAKITGGIGNQLFQYAFIRSLALKLNEKFTLDLSWYRDYHKYEDINNPNSATKREYLLNNFNIEEKIISPHYLSISYRVEKYKFLNIIPLLKYFQYDIIDEDTFDINNIPQNTNVYLRGFWQNSTLFTEYGYIFRNEFTLKNNLSEPNQDLLNQIKSVNSVAIHIRRGDLLSRPVAVEDQPYSADKYYEDSVNIIYEKVDNPQLFIFSDDIDWVKKNHKFGLPTYYVDTDGPDHEHFNLMCHCKHHVIANSTFSWWAAWLNKFKNKIVISPKWWYRDPIKNSKVIWIPEEWIVLNNI